MKKISSKKTPAYAYAMLYIGAIIGFIWTFFGERLFSQAVVSIAVFVVGITLLLCGYVLLMKYLGKYYVNVMFIDDNRVRFSFNRVRFVSDRKDDYSANLLQGMLKNRTLIISDCDGIVAKIYKNYLINKDDWEFLLDYFKLS